MTFIYAYYLNHGIVESSLILFERLLKSLGKSKMEKIKLTAQEVMDKLKWKKSTVYYWINSKKFETVQTPKGVMVLLTQKEIDEYGKIKIPKDSKTVQEDSETVYKSFNNSTNDFQESFRPSESQTISKMLDTMRYTIESIKEESSKSTKLLTDSENRTLNDYLEIKQESKILQESNKSLELEKVKLALELEQTKKSTNIILVSLSVLVLIVVLAAWGLISFKLNETKLLQKNLKQNTQEIKALHGEIISKNDKINALTGNR